MKVFIGIVFSIIALNTFSKDIDTVLFAGVVSLDSYFSESDPLIYDASNEMVASLERLFNKNGNTLIKKSEEDFNTDAETSEGDESVESLHYITASFISLDDSMPAILLVYYTPDGISLIETVGVFISVEDVRYIVEDFYFEIQNQ